MADILLAVEVYDNISDAWYIISLDSLEKGKNKAFNFDKKFNIILKTLIEYEREELKENGDYEEPNYEDFIMKAHIETGKYFSHRIKSSEDLNFFLSTYGSTKKYQNTKYISGLRGRPIDSSLHLEPFYQPVISFLTLSELIRVQWYDRIDRIEEYLPIDIEPQWRDDPMGLQLILRLKDFLSADNESRNRMRDYNVQIRVDEPRYLENIAPLIKIISNMEQFVVKNKKNLNELRLFLIFEE